eukprot:11222931-Lingulodinium_polyedra.AAC.1
MFRRGRWRRHEFSARSRVFIHLGATRASFPEAPRSHALCFLISAQGVREVLGPPGFAVWWRSWMAYCVAFL